MAIIVRQSLHDENGVTQYLCENTRQDKYARVEQNWPTNGYVLKFQS